MALLALTCVALIASLGISLTFHFLRYYFFPALPASIPRLGNEFKGRLRLKTRLRLLVDCERLYQEAYTQYSSNGRTCIVPGLGLDEIVVLPKSSLQWWGKQSSDVLSLPMALAKIFKSKYTNQAEYYLLHPWLDGILRQRISKFVQDTTKILGQKMRHVFNVQIGGEPGEQEWRTLRVHATMRMIISHLACCFSAIDEDSLSENPQYIRDCCDSADIMMTCAGILALFPPFLQPLVSSIICIPMRMIERRTQHTLTPIMERRLAMLNNGKGEEVEHGETDRLQMTLCYGKLHAPHELNPRDFTGRWITGNMAVIDQTSHALSNVVLNILGSDSEYNTLAILRAEIQEVLEKHGGQWNKASTAQMVMTDSVIRETLRIHTVGGRVLRIVSAEEGITTEDGHHLPKGTAVSMLTRAAHLDPLNYANPKTFDPFRFARPSAPSESSSESCDDPGQVQGANSLLALSSSHLAFGFGKHACPGRYVIDVEIKMILCYLLFNYDLKLARQHEGVRPSNVYRGEALFPPTDAKMEVKRRPMVNDPFHEIW